MDDDVTKVDTKPTALRSQPDEYDPNPIYFFGNGVPRMDTVLPSDILDEIWEAGEEVLRTRRRIDMLREVLVAPSEDGDGEVDSGTATTKTSLAATTTTRGDERRKKTDHPTAARRLGPVTEGFGICMPLFQY